MDKLGEGLFVGAILDGNQIAIGKNHIIGSNASIDNVLDIVRAVAEGCSDVAIVTKAAEVASIGKLQGHAITSEANINLHDVV